MGAWVVRGRWTPQACEQYRGFVSGVAMAGRPVAGLTRFTCEDYPLALLIEYAARCGLPVRIDNGGGTRDSRDDAYRSLVAYRDVVLSTTGAADLARAENTVAAASGVAPGSATALRRAAAGDIVLLGRAPAFFHAQVVTRARPGRVEIAQGNFATPCTLGHIREWLSLIVHGEDDPRGVCYVGVEPKRGVYDFATDTYTREDNRMRIDKAFIPGSVVRRWNFAAFETG